MRGGWEGREKWLGGVALGAGHCKSVDRFARFRKVTRHSVNYNDEDEEDDEEEDDDDRSNHPEARNVRAGGGGAARRARRDTHGAAASVATWQSVPLASTCAR